MKTKYVFLILFVSVFLVGGVFGFRWWKANTSPVSSRENYRSFLIQKGRSATQIGNLLHEEGLIKNPLAFKFYVQFSGKQGSISAGEFRLSPSMSLAEIVESLQGGPMELWVTIPEGLRREEVVEVFIGGLEKSEKDAEVFRLEFLSLSEKKEGYLFPDTYLFPPNTSASVVVDRLTRIFKARTDGIEITGLAKSHGFDEVVTMASILERETVTDEERPIVAGILWKRLETDGWLLQADATNQFALGTVNCQLQVADCDNWWPILTKDDLEIVSPYNSYKYKSLPPTPIANPGLSSIRAAANPTSSDYWFYIHDLDGQIHYGKTIADHNANVRKYLGK